MSPPSAIGIINTVLDTKLTLAPNAIILAAAAIFPILFVLIYFAAVHHNGYWRRRGVGGPPPRPFVGNMDEWFQKTPITLQLQKWTKRYGRTYGVQEGRANILVTSDVEILRELFVTKFEYFHGRKLSPESGNVDSSSTVHVFSARGARWQRLRAISDAAFSVNNLKKMLPVMHDSTHVMMDHLEIAQRNGTSVNLVDHFNELSFDVIMRLVMGQRGSRQFCNVEGVRNLKQQCESLGRSNLYYYGRIVGEHFNALVHVAALAHAVLTRSPMAVTLGYITKRIQQRKALRQKCESSKDGVVDLIDIFLDLENNDALQVACEKPTFNISKGLTIDEIKAQCYIFLLAGFDAAASSLSVTCHYLARNPEAQSRLRDEILDVCGPDGNPSYEQLQQLRYADAVMDESLRLCPIAASVCARQCSKTTNLGPYTIEEGTYVQADVFAVHRDRSVWGEDADEFRPDRWLEEGTAGRVAGSLNWMPFGAGPRLCVGMRFAYLEEKLALVRLLRAYAIRPAADAEDAMDLRGEMGLSPKQIIVTLKPLQ